MLVVAVVWMDRCLPGQIHNAYIMINTLNKYELWIATQNADYRRITSFVSTFFVRTEAGYFIPH